MARLDKDMVDVKYEVHKLMKVPKGGAEIARLREEFAEVKLEVAKLAEHPAYTQGEGGSLEKREGRSDKSKKRNRKIKRRCARDEERN